MRFSVPNKLNQNLYVILRRAGYMPIHDRTSGKNSYSRKISTGHYPRFHLYIKEKTADITFDLHLDQTASRYEGQTAHNADYDSPEVKQELHRLSQYVQMALPASAASEKEDSPTLAALKRKPASKQGWLSKIFGK